MYYTDICSNYVPYDCMTNMKNIPLIFLDFGSSNKHINEIFNLTQCNWAKKKNVTEVQTL